MFTFQKNCVDINLSTIIKPYWLANTAFLPYVIQKLKEKLADRSVNIYALAETPIGIEPYSAVINIIVDNLKISPDRIIVHTRDPNFYHAGVTKKTHNSWDESNRTKDLDPYLLSLDLIQPATDSRRFGALFGRIELGRILLAYHLERFHDPISVVSFLASRECLGHEIFGMEMFFDDISLWWNTRQNPAVSAVAEHPWGEYNWPENILTYPSIAKLFQIEIVGETQCDHVGGYTEKTWRCLAAGKPFLLLSGSGSIRLLRDLGFQTYHPWIDESYDHVTDLIGRIEAIQTEIDRLASLNDAQWQHTVIALYEIARRNREFYHEWNPEVLLP